MRHKLDIACSVVEWAAKTVTAPAAVTDVVEACRAVAAGGPAEELKTERANLLDALEDSRRMGGSGMLQGLTVRYAPSEIAIDAAAELVDAASVMDGMDGMDEVRRYAEARVNDAVAYAFDAVAELKSPQSHGYDENAAVKAELWRMFRRWTPPLAVQ